MKIRACKKDDKKMHIGLINKIFRENNGLEPTMDKEFLCLLGEDNISNNLVCEDKNEIVGCVNYYHSNIVLKDYKIPVSSIGAVCTREDYRGRNIICDILKVGDKRSLEKESCLLIISGLRRVYFNHGASQASLLNKFSINDNRKTNVDIREFKDSDLDILIKLYNKEPLRFLRGKNEFKRLMDGAMVNWGNNINRLFLVYSNETPKGYIMLQLDKCSKDAVVREYAGSRKVIFEGLYQLKTILDLEVLTIATPINDDLIYIMEKNNVNGNVIDQWVAIKIIDFKRLMSILHPYFCEFIDEEKLKNLKIDIDDGKFKFSYRNDEFIIDDVNELNRLVFGHSTYSLNNLKNGELRDMLRSMFPLSMVNTHGMNFQ